MSDLLPAESIALTVALAIVLRGDPVPPNMASMCVLALARLTGKHDWTDEDQPLTEPLDPRRDDVGPIASNE